jgi:hypothetical protein
VLSQITIILRAFEVQFYLLVLSLISIFLRASEVQFDLLVLSVINIKGIRTSVLSTVAIPNQYLSEDI